MKQIDDGKGLPPDQVFDSIRAELRAMKKAARTKARKS
jgi:hypothetical protein